MLGVSKRTYKQEFSPVHKLFHSILITDITSLKHKTLSIKAEHCLLYSLSFFKQTTHTLYECLDNYFMEEKLEGDNAWLHEKTNKKIPVFKKTYILYSPEIIIIDLKRWVNPYKKIQTLVTTDLTIDLEKYCIVKDNSSVYELYGVCNHFHEQSAPMCRMATTSTCVSRCAGGLAVLIHRAWVVSWGCGAQSQRRYGQLSERDLQKEYVG